MRVAQAILGVIAIAGVLTLLLLPKPWDLPAPERPLDFVAFYGRWAGAMNVLLVTFLALSVPLWLKGERPRPGWCPRPPRAPASALILTALAMVICLATGVPRLGQSLWDDEENSARRIVAGKFKMKDNGDVRFKRTKWSSTFWDYSRPTNHHLQSILSKISLQGWQNFARSAPSPISEAAMRFPSLLGGLGALAALALLLWRIGFARAAGFAALALALHPWFLRYATEMRGYVFAMLFLLLGLFFLIEAMESGRWRWWIALALSWLLMLYSYPGTLFVAFGFWGLAFFGILLRNPRLSRGSQLWRWIVSSTVAGMIFLQLFLPCFPQVGEFMRNVMSGTLTQRWHHNVYAHFFSGIPWNNSDDRLSGYLELKWLAESQPAFYLLAFAMLLGLLFLGVARLCLRWPVGWMIALIYTLPPLAVYWMAKLQERYLYEWYLIFILPGVVAAVVLALEWPISLWEKLRGKSRPLPDAVGYLLLVPITCFAFLTQPARSFLVGGPLEPMREAVELARGGITPLEPNSNDVYTAALATRVELYDPQVRRPMTLAELLELKAQASSEGKPLYVISGNQWALAAGAPDLVKLLKDPTQFTKVEELRGLDPTLTQFVWKSVDH